MLINNKLKDLIEKNAMSLATVSYRSPHVIGVAFVKIISKNQILVTNNCMNVTINNLKKNNNVALAVWDKDWNGYQMLGTAKYFTSGKWMDFVKKMPENKNEKPKGAILITINKIKKT